MTRHFGKMMITRYYSGFGIPFKPTEMEIFIRGISLTRNLRVCIMKKGDMKRRFFGFFGDFRLERVKTIPRVIFRMGRSWKRGKSGNDEKD